MAFGYGMNDGVAMPERFAPPVTIRRAEARDAPFVMATWLRGLWQRPHRLRWKEHKARCGAELQALLRQPETRVLIAGSETDYDYGWLAYSDIAIPTVHWMHVKSKWRGMGIGSALLAHAGLTSESRLLYTGPGEVAKHWASKFAHAEHLSLEEYLE